MILSYDQKFLIVFVVWTVLGVLVMKLAARSYDEFRIQIASHGDLMFAGIALWPIVLVCLIYFKCVNWIAK